MQVCCKVFSLWCVVTLKLITHVFLWVQDFFLQQQSNMFSLLSVLLHSCVHIEIFHELLISRKSNTAWSTYLWGAQSLHELVCLIPLQSLMETQLSWLRHACMDLQRSLPHLDHFCMRNELQISVFLSWQCIWGAKKLVKKVNTENKVAGGPW